MSKLDLYEVQHRGHTTTMKLSAEDADAYRDRDGLRVKKLGPAKPAERQDVTAPTHAVDEQGEPLPEAKAGTVRSRSRQPKNK